MRKHESLHPVCCHDLRTILAACTPRLTLALAVTLSGCGNSSLKVTPPDGGSGGVAAASGAGGAHDASATGPGNSGGTGGGGGYSSNGGIPGSGGRVDSSGAGGTDGGLSRGSGGIVTTGVGGASGGSGPGDAGGSSSSGGRGGAGGLAGHGGAGSGGTTANPGTSSAGSGGRGGSSGDGGTQATGGKTSSGGVTSTGGMGTGGVTNHGGTQATGGKTSSGGVTSTGGMGTGGVGGTDGGGGSSGSPFQGVINAFCATARVCCAQAGWPASDLTDCETKFATYQAVIHLVDLGQASINATALAACEAAYKQAASTCTTGQVVTACIGIFVGLEAENQPCGKGGNPMVPGALACKQVGGPEVCLWTAPDTSDPSVAGVCKKIVRGKLGEACEWTCEIGENCAAEVLTGPGDTGGTWCFEEDGLYCSYQSGMPSCASLKAVNADCSADSDACGSANYCDINLVCKAKASLGQSCSSTPCARPNTCSTSNTCEVYDPPFADRDFSCKGYAPELL